MIVRVLIINLAIATTRMTFQAAQMMALSLTWERMEAATPETLPLPLDDSHWRRWERPMRATEIAGLASHCAAWERVRTADAPHLIIEDDALLASGTPALLQESEDETGLDHVTLETRSRKKLVGRMHPNLPIRRLYQDRTGAAAYVLWPSGAEKLLARADRYGIIGKLDPPAVRTRSLSRPPARLAASHGDPPSVEGRRGPKAADRTLP